MASESTPSGERRAADLPAYFARESERAPPPWSAERAPGPRVSGGRWGLLEGVRPVGIAPSARHRAYWDYELGNREGVDELERAAWVDLAAAEPAGQDLEAAEVGRFDGRGPERSGRGLRGVGPRAYRRSDERLRDDAWERLARDPDLDASRMTVEVEDGEVALRGAVDDPRDRAVAEAICAEIPGVRGVYNRIRAEGLRPGWEQLRAEARSRQA